MCECDADYPSSSDVVARRVSIGRAAHAAAAASASALCECMNESVGIRSRQSVAVTMYGRYERVDSSR